MENKSCCDTKGGKALDKTGCWTKILAGGVIGGVVMFFYMGLSWMVLPFHGKAMHGFTNEASVARVLEKNAPVSGIYVLPQMDDGSEDSAPEKKKSKKAKTDTTLTKPFAFVSVFADGADPSKMGRQLGKQLIICVLMAGILTALLKRISCGCPVLASMKIGLLAGLIGPIGQWIWFRFPGDFTLVSLIDSVVIFTLAGMVISKIVLGHSCKMGECCK